MKMESIKKATLLGIVTVFISTTQNTQAIELPVINTEGLTLESFIPEGWSLMKGGSIKGDLNDDGIQDIAAIFEANETIPISSSAGDTVENTEPQPIKPRILTVLFAQKNGSYKLSTQANHGILRDDEVSVISNPIAYMRIRRNALHVGYVGADVNKNHWEIVARFRYRNNDWYMTGYKKSNYIAATSQVIKNDYNAMTGKMRVTTQSLNVNAEDDGVKRMTRWEQVEKTQKVKLSSFNPWTVIRAGEVATAVGK